MHGGSWMCPYCRRWIGAMEVHQDCARKQDELAKRRASLLSPNPFPSTKDDELTFAGTIMGNTSIVCAVHRRFRGHRLTIYSTTKNIEVLNIVFEKTGAVVERTGAMVTGQRMHARFFRPTTFIHHRSGLVAVCEQTLDLPTANAGERVLLEVFGPVGRRILAQIHGQSAL